MTSLTEKQMVELHRIYLDTESGTPAIWRGNATARRLVSLGLVRQWEETIYGTGRGIIDRIPMTGQFCDLTAEGHAYHEALGLPLNARDRKFLSRRAGACIPTFPALLSCRARGLVTVKDERPGAYARWCRTPGKADRWRAVPDEQQHSTT